MRNTGVFFVPMRFMRILTDINRFVIAAAASHDTFAARRWLTACLEKEGGAYAGRISMASPVLT
jgi:hypothetical protein